MMSHFLSKEEYLPYAPDYVGQVHVNHVDCEAGTDTKRRLYIRRLEDGDTILAYCHHCGKSGVTSKDKFRSLETIKRLAVHTDSGPPIVALPSDFEPDPRRWVPKARAWVYQYGITEDELKRYGIGYSERLRRVILPVWQDAELLGFQARKIFDDDTMPKYLTYGKKKIIWKNLTISDSVLVLCEDVLSAIKLCRYYSSIALLGTYLHKDYYKYLLSFKTILIYLDNNNSEVQMQAFKLKRDISVFVPDTHIIILNKDPKCLTNEELRNLQEEE